MPDYVGRKVKKDFQEDGGVFFEIVLASEACLKTKALLHHVGHSDGDKEDFCAKEVVELLVPVDEAEVIEDDVVEADGDKLAGINRRRLHGLVRLVKHNAHVPVNWRAHQTRFKHQDFHIEKERGSMEEGDEFVRSCIDFKAKTLPSKRSTAQGEGMGLRGLSLAGGRFEFMRIARNGKKCVDRQQIHVVFSHGSKQQVTTPRAVSKRS
jgi:hypothetical protein